MTPAEVIVDGLERVRESGLAVLDGLTPDQLAHRPTPDANPIGWLVWHLARVQDDHVAGVAGSDQVYGSFVERFALPYDDDAIGFGQSSADVGAGTWDAVLLAVKDRKKTAHAQLTTAQVLGVQGRTATLSFTHAPILRAFQSSTGVDVLKEALRETLGADLEIACVVGTGEAPARSAWVSAFLRRLSKNPCRSSKMV